MKKQTKTLFILAGALLLCAVAYVGLLWWNSAQAGNAAEDLAYVVRMEDLTEIAVERDGAIAAYTKGGDGSWFSADQPELPLRQSYLTDLVDTLGALEAVKTISDPEADSSYGLDAPSCKIVAESSDGTINALIVGSEVNGGYYARVDGETAVYTISSTLMDQTGYDLLSMIERDTIPTVTEENFNALTLVKEGKSYEYTKEQLEDDTALTAAVGSLAGLSFTDTYAWRPTDEQLAAAGLDAPTALTVSYNEDGVYTLELGAADGSGYYYARLKDSEQVNMISATLVQPLLTLAAEE